MKGAIGQNQPIILVCQAIVGIVAVSVLFGEKTFKIGSQQYFKISLALGITDKDATVESYMTNTSSSIANLYFQKIGKDENLTL